MPYPILGISEHMLTVCMRVHKLESKMLDDAAKPDIARKLVHYLAEQIVHYKLDARERDFEIDYRIEVVVMTPNEMAKLIQNEAYRMYHHLLNSPDATDQPKEPTCRTTTTQKC